MNIFVIGTGSEIHNCKFIVLNSVDSEEIIKLLKERGAAAPLDADSNKGNDCAVSGERKPNCLTVNSNVGWGVPFEM